MPAGEAYPGEAEIERHPDLLFKLVPADPRGQSDRPPVVEPPLEVHASDLTPAVAPVNSKAPQTHLWGSSRFKPGALVAERCASAREPGHTMSFRLCP